MVFLESAHFTGNVSEGGGHWQEPPSTTGKCCFPASSLYCCSCICVPARASPRRAATALLMCPGQSLGWFFQLLITSRLVNTQPGGLGASASEHGQGAHFLRDHEASLGGGDEASEGFGSSQGHKAAAWCRGKVLPGGKEGLRH